jgi:hypothetical protein
MIILGTIFGLPKISQIGAIKATTAPALFWLPQIPQIGANKDHWFWFSPYARIGASLTLVPACTEATRIS